MNDTSLTRIFRRHAASALMAGALLSAGALAQAQMLQAPIQTGGTEAPPNVMFTLDDSGSMWWECPDDAMCTTNSKGVGLAPVKSNVSGRNALTHGFLIYDDAPLPYSATRYYFHPNANAAVAGPNNQTPAIKGPQLSSRRLRSAVNPLYYNPNIRYQGWTQANGQRLSGETTITNARTKVPPGGSTYLQNLSGVQDVTDSMGMCYEFHPELGTNPKCASTYGLKQQAHVARYYLLKDGKTDSTDPHDFVLIKIQAGNSPAYPVDVNGAVLPKAPGRTDCQGTSCTGNEELQNFANWYTYHRMRALAAIAGTAEAFTKVPEEFRVGYGSINTVWPGFSGYMLDDVKIKNTLVRGVRPFTGAGKSDFYDWLLAKTKPNGGTPLPRAVDAVGTYFSRADDKGPWSDNPATGETGPHSGCRRSVHILMTDGYWNSTALDNATLQGLNVDGNPGSEITGPGGQTYTYTPTTPYRDGWSQTLADVALHYWYRDLRPDIPNELKPITKPGSENPAFWQHVSLYTIAFGVSGTLQLPTTNPPDPGDLPALLAGTKTWPDPIPNNGNSDSDNKAAADDLWHAAINSRGRMLSAKDPNQYGAKLGEIIEDVIGSIKGSESGVAVSSTSLPSTGSSTRKYTPSFDASGWTGDVIAENVNARGEPVNTAWSATEQIPAAASRNIFTYQAAKATDWKGVPFKWGDLNAQMKTALLSGNDGATQNLLGYLRGNATGEGTTYRKRESKLGDIVNSTPAFALDLGNSYYQYLPKKGETIDFGAESYPRFLRAKKLRTGHLVVGANDGMLHIFRDDNGQEAFAYVPWAIYGDLRNLADPNYTHQYFVDGPVAEADVYGKVAWDTEDPTTRWHNLVQGAGGAGGKYVYSIRMPVANWSTGSTPPAALTPGQSQPQQKDILWELNTGSGQDFADHLGYILTRPVTGVLQDGTWVTIFGNGYKSASGKAVLFVVDALKGTLLKAIDTGAGSLLDPNGLGGIGVVRDAQQRIVQVYGGDLHGKLWRFDLQGKLSGQLLVGFAGTPLFTAKNGSNQREPITAAPNFRAHPKGGVMVLFGSGKLFEVADKSDSQERTLYGIWDGAPLGSSQNVTDQRWALADSSRLVTQSTVTTPIEGSVGAVYRKLTITPVDYKETGPGDTSSRRGWRLPLVIGVGERLINEPQLRYDLVFMQTMRPTAGASGGCGAVGMQRYGYLLDPFMSGVMSLPFDANADGTYDSQIVELTGTGENLLVTKTPKAGDSTREGVIMGAGSGGLPVRFQYDGRHYWRQIMSPPR